jgi:hypothetical protein
MASPVRKRGRLYFSDSRPKLEEDINTHPRFTRILMGCSIIFIFFPFPDFFWGSRLRIWKISV